MKKFVLSLVAATLLIVSASAFEFDYVYDGADLFDSDAEYENSLPAENVYSNSGLLTVVVTDYGIHDILSVLPTYSYGAEDMLLFAIDMQERQFELYQYNATYGESAFRVSYAESEIILDSVFPDMASGDYTTAALLFISLADKYFSNLEAFSPDTVGDGYEYIDFPQYEEPLSAFDIIAMALLFGAFVGGVAVFIVFLSYKRKVHGSTYPLGQFSNLKITDTRDTFVTKKVIVTHIPDPPKSSGGGGFHSSGGGARMGGRSF